MTYKFPTRMVVVERVVNKDKLITIQSPSESNGFFVKLYEEMVKELEEQIQPGKFTRRSIGVVSKLGKPIHRFVHEQWFAVPPPEFNVERDENGNAVVTVGCRCLAVSYAQRSKRRLEFAQQAAMSPAMRDSDHVAVPKITHEIAEAANGG